jgi:hypothetical protein
MRSARRKDRRLVVGGGGAYMQGKGCKGRGEEEVKRGIEKEKDAEE